MGKRKNWELVTLIFLFLFSISIFNLAGYLYAIGIIVLLVMCGNKIKISRDEILIMMFSFLFFSFYTYHFGLEIQSIIVYLFGPWTAYIIGKMYVERAKGKNAFFEFIIVMAAGMFVHGLLNLVAYIRSEHYETYQYYRRSVDFWHGEVVNVNTTGMLYTFATGICIGILFSNVAQKIKIIATCVLSCCIGATIFFANRTLLFIAAIIFLWKGLCWLFSKEVKSKSKIVAVISLLVIVILITIVILYNVAGIGDWVYSLKIIQRFVSDNESMRFDVWEYFIKDLSFARYPFGGGHMLKDAPFSYFHNMWLDVYNRVGLVPFGILLVFTFCMIKSFIKFRNIMLKKQLKDDYLVFQCLIFAILLNCLVEPIIEANPYYFLATMMFLGAMIGKIRKEK